jgi:phenylacetic acid degradation operon negative regulatory protein
VAQTEELAGTVLVRLLGDLGLGASAARGQLARMRRDGQLAVTRRGRVAHYRLAGPFAATFRRLRAGAPVTAPQWTGHFHALLYQVPEEQRAYRDRLRRIAQLIGYGLMQRGVLIAASDLSTELAAVLADAPPGCRVQPATICLPTADAATIARSAWNLDTVEANLRRHLATLSDALAADDIPPPTATTLVRLAQLLNATYVDLIEDPQLPTALLPPSWPRPHLDRLISRVRERLLPPAARYIHSLIASSD